MGKMHYVCNECGAEFPKWSGKCFNCSAWNSLEEVETLKTQKASGVSCKTLKYITLSEISTTSEVRFDTGMAELNRVLGGGLVKGSMVLLSGDPGIGKSTLLLQICNYLGVSHTVLYVTGEESERQIKLRAERLRVNSKNLYIIADTNCDAVIDAISKNKPDVVIIDSIQTMEIEGVTSSLGSLVQVRECTNALTKVAKTLEIPIFIVGHINKDGGIAGPKVLEHIVDTVLYFEGDRELSYRILRTSKNRFGSTNEIGVFEMLDRGLVEVPNPSAMLLSGRPINTSGISILCTMEGTRPILAEAQALVCKSSFSTPRRVATGFDYNRLCLILAVLEKRTGFVFSAVDVYINVIGGLKIEEPAADLALALALYSGLCDIPISEGLVAFGEIGLGGEIRNISSIHERIKECARMGFKSCIIPKAALKVLDKTVNYGINIIGVSDLKQAFKAVDRVNANENAPAKQ